MTKFLSVLFERKNKVNETIGGWTGAFNLLIPSIFEEGHKHTHTVSLRGIYLSQRLLHTKKGFKMEQFFKEIIYDFRWKNIENLKVNSNQQSNTHTHTHAKSEQALLKETHNLIPAM